MSAATDAHVLPARDTQVWVLWIALILGLAIPVLGTVFVRAALPGWTRLALPFHATLEVAGAALGLVLAVLILASRESALTSRRMWVVLALISMTGLDILHSCVSAEISFVWLHSLAVLAGGVFFALVWFPEREISRGTIPPAVGGTIIVTMLLGIFAVIYPESLPIMTVENDFTPEAKAINFVGGGLTLLAAVNFAIHYYRKRNPEEILFMLLCLLFGGAGILFQMSHAWGPGWWFWHVLRLSGYILAFGLALLSYRKSEDKYLRAHGELNSLFQKAVDGKRLVDRDFNHIRINEQFATLSGVSSEAAETMKCYEAFPGPLCHSDQCPLLQLRTGEMESIHLEVTKTRRDGRDVACVMKAIRLNALDGSYRGIIESYLDITERKLAENKLSALAAHKTAQAELAELMRGELKIEEMCRNIIVFLCKYLQAPIGVMYLMNVDGTLNLMASYAFKRRKHIAGQYKPGEGLVGQAALEREEIILTNVPKDYIAIESGLGEIVPRNIYVKPVIFNDEVVGVIEIGTLETFTAGHSDFLKMVSDNIAVAINSAKSRTQLASALEESQRLTEELQTQQEELQTANEELEEQTLRLQQSEGKLKTQQEELQVINEELEEKNDLLERQKREVEVGRKEIEEKAEELALASKYKSEFLANMSHELRTPLNSLLLLAQGLVQNKTENLTKEQVEWAKIIHSSGNDLLSLINEILDLSKIEAGRMDLNITPVRISDLAEGVRVSFSHVAEEKGFSLEIEVSGDAPAEIVSDRKRIEQVIRNLMSNAIKFTETGGVTVTFGRPGPGKRLSRRDLSPDHCLAVMVKDTGIGIASEHQKLVFEAFQQADGGTSRKYGGTGLGLSISRELVRLLGGEMQLESELGKGSTFTLILPIEINEAWKPDKSTLISRARPQRHTRKAPDSRKPFISDDRDDLSEAEKIILVIEDDTNFARVLYDQCHARGFKCLAAPTGEVGLSLANTHLPDGIILDIRLPGMDGLTVLGKLKEDIRTRHIPVHIISVEDMKTESLRRGAIAHATKPISKEELEKAFEKIEEMSETRAKRVLLVEDDDTMRRSVKELIEDGDVRIDEAATAGQAIEALRTTAYDCLILDLRLPDMNGAEMLKTVEAEGLALPPVIVHTALNLTEQEERELREHAESIVIKDVRSQERLLDEVSLFLHRMVDKMPEPKEQMIRNLYETDTLLQNKKVLVVDDDMRATFALSRLLSERGMKALKAGNGEQAIQMLDRNPDLDVVIMDIMMPVMDGYETMKRIRAQDKYRNLPIIALTAKAMPDDHRKCIEAGANDYLPKPVDLERLVSMMRVWLYR